MTRRGCTPRVAPPERRSWIHTRPPQERATMPLAGLEVGFLVDTERVAYLRTIYRILRESSFSVTDTRNMIGVLLHAGHSAEFDFRTWTRHPDRWTA